jgi:uncharacterized membrane protein YidH (DUF202 family)
VTSDPGWLAEGGGDAAVRTALAWQRSGLALAATGAAVARGVPGSGVGDRPVAGALVTVLGLSVWLVTSVAERRRRAAARRPAATMGDVVPLAAASVVVGLILFVLAAWPR